MHLENNVHRRKLIIRIAVCAFAFLTAIWLVFSNSGNPVVVIPATNPVDEPSRSQNDAEETQTDPKIANEHRPSSLYPALSSKRVASLQAHVCPNTPQPATFDTLTSFSFWGQTMNTSSPCPTSGMNNQMAMLVGLLYCATQQGDKGGEANSRSATISADLLLSGTSSSSNLGHSTQVSEVKLSPAVFRFKDISCSPTGGKEGSKRFKVGSDDYEYAWFRWSEVFDVNTEGAVAGIRDSNDAAEGGKAPVTRVCLRDQFTWSEHKWMKARTCATTVDHFYGTELYWRIRGLLPLHQWFFRLSEEFLKTSSSSSSLSLHVDRTADFVNKSDVADSLRSLRARTMAIHVRRGDYYNFCKGTSKSSGVKKFRIAPFIWMKNNGAKSEAAGLNSKNDEGEHYNGRFLNLTSVSSLSSKFMDSCAPHDSKVIQSVESILAENRKRCAESTEAAVGTTSAFTACIDLLVVMTNSGEFYEKIKAHFSDKPHGPRVVSMRDWTHGGSHGIGTVKATLHKVQWPTRRKALSDSQSIQEPFPSQLTATEAAMMDVALLSMADTIVLNRYSTFSQSAIDVRAVRDGTLEGLRLYWW